MQRDSGKPELASQTMSQETQPPRLFVPVVLALCTGIAACVAAFVTHKFLLLFFTAGAI